MRLAQFSEGASLVWHFYEITNSMFLCSQMPSSTLHNVELRTSRELWQQVSASPQSLHVLCDSAALEMAIGDTDQDTFVTRNGTFSVQPALKPRLALVRVLQKAMSACRTVLEGWVAKVQPQYYVA